MERFQNIFFKFYYIRYFIYNNKKVKTIPEENRLNWPLIYTVGIYLSCESVIISTIIRKTG